MAEDGIPDDTERVLRYLAKVTIEPAISHGSPSTSDRCDRAALADIVLWKPAWFGAKPELVLKSGFPAWGPLGEGNATVERAEPTRYRPDWGGTPRAARSLGVTFVARESPWAPSVALDRRPELVPIGRTRGLTRGTICCSTAHPRRSRSTRWTAR
jgi:urease subunit alpha